MAERSAVTVMPLLAGLVPDVTFTVKVVEAPGKTEFGLADPVPLGFVGLGVGVSVGVGVAVGVAVGVGVGVTVGVVILHGFNAEAVLRGFGAATVKSVLLLSVSVQPFPALKSPVVLPGAGAGALPSKPLAVVPKPIKSTIPAPVPVVTVPVRAVVLLTSATLPAVALMAMVPVAFAAGRSVVPPVPADS